MGSSESTLANLHSQPGDVITTISERTESVDPLLERLKSLEIATPILTSPPTENSLTDILVKKPSSTSVTGGFVASQQLTAFLTPGAEFYWDIRGTVECRRPIEWQNSGLTGSEEFRGDEKISASWEIIEKPVLETRAKYARERVRCRIDKGKITLLLIAYQIPNQRISARVKAGVFNKVNGTLNPKVLLELFSMYRDWQEEKARKISQRQEEIENKIEVADALAVKLLQRFNYSVSTMRTTAHNLSEVHPLQVEVGELKGRLTEVLSNCDALCKRIAVEGPESLRSSVKPFAMSKTNLELDHGSSPKISTRNTTPT